MDMVWFAKRQGVLALLMALLPCRSAAAAGELPEGWLEQQANERQQKCEYNAEQRGTSERLLLACGTAGVWEIALTGSGPRFVRSYEFPGEVIGFLAEADGRLWVKLRLLEARRFSPVDGAGVTSFPEALPPAAVSLSPSPVPAAPPRPPAAKGVGRVVGGKAGTVEISLGAADGLQRSDRIALSPAPDDETGEANLDLFAVGVVTNVSEHHSNVRLGLNERVPIGAIATPTRAPPTASLSAPPRVTGVTELTAIARPFAALGELGGGLLLSGSIGRRFGSWHLEAVIDPIGYADVKYQDGVAVANGALLASYDSQYFEIGLGLGAQTVNEAGSFTSPGSGLTVVQAVRLGVEDGLSLHARSSLVLFHSQFDFGGLVVDGRIPLVRGYWLLLGGGGGTLGYGFAEFGLRALLRGNGRAGSTFLSIAAGGAGVFKSGTCDEFFVCTSDRSFAGPVASIGSEWRF